MALKDRLDSDLDCFFSEDDFGETAVYTAKDGSTTNIVVLPSFQENLFTRSSGMSSGQYKTAFFDIRANQIIPRIHETITHNSIIWTVREVVPGYDGRINRVKVTTNERASF